MSVSRSLISKAILWNISDPLFDYIDSTFQMQWEVSDYIQDRFLSYTVYDGWNCKEGSNDITGAINDYNNNNLYLQNLGIQPDRYVVAIISPHRLRR